MQSALRPAWRARAQQTKEMVAGGLVGGGVGWLVAKEARIDEGGVAAQVPGNCARRGRREPKKKKKGHSSMDTVGPRQESRRTERNEIERRETERWSNKDGERR